MENIIHKAVGLDNNESIFFTRELEHKKANAYNVLYPEYQFASGALIPISNEAGEGAESIVYEQYDTVGMAKVISNYADDLPASDVKGKEFSSIVKSLGTSFTYNIQEIRAAQKAGKPLRQKKADAAMRSMNQLIDNIGLNGDTVNNLTGFNDTTNATEYTMPSDGTAAAKTIASKTPDLVIRDLNAIANLPVTTTKGVEIPDTMLIPLAQYNDIATRRVTDTNETILQYFLKNNPYIKSVIPVPKLVDAGASSTARIWCYKNSPDKLTYEMPQMIEFLPEQPDNLAFKTPVHARNGGVLIYYPLSRSFADGV